MRQAREPRPDGRDMAADYRVIEPNWDEAGEFSPFLFCRQRHGAMLASFRMASYFDASGSRMRLHKATLYAEVIGAGGAP